jgi:Kef-type K+ transport system membrane component KefB
MSDTTSPPHSKRWIIAYALMALATVGAFLLIRAYGTTLAHGSAGSAIAGEASVTHPAPQSDLLLRVLIALAAVVIGGQVFGWLFKFVNQPPVIGEVVVGILLGPSLIGPNLSGLILPPAIQPVIGGIAQLGVILYMFIVGLELNASLLRRRAHVAAVISQAGIAVPFVLGAALALWLFPRFAPAEAPFTSFALFMGIAMSITAFPVLARILTDWNMARSELGVLALCCAATDDLTAWCLLAFVVGVVKAQVGSWLLVAAGTAAYIAAMYWIVRPAVQWFVRRWNQEPLPRTATAVALTALLLSALATEAIGIHAIFGAFLLGAVIPHDSVVARSLTRQLENLVTVLLLPAFFAFTGMRTRLDLVSGADQWLICAVIILAATAGKFGGTLVAGRLMGLDLRFATALGVLMNTRGLMELIVLNIGLDLGIISPTLFSMLVLMALATTLATPPLVRRLAPASLDTSRTTPLIAVDTL